MHKYIIKLTKYTEAGVPTNDINYVTSDTPQGLADKVKQYNKMRYTTTDPENGETIIGNKMYKVEPMQGEYVVISDWYEFCRVNKVLAD